jgi:hypothetical protein
VTDLQNRITVVESSAKEVQRWLDANPPEVDAVMTRKLLWELAGDIHYLAVLLRKHLETGEQ